MLFLGTHIIVDDHFHVQSVISLLLQTFLEFHILVLLCFGDLLDDLFVNFLDELLAFHDLLDGFLVFVHLA